MPDNEPDRDPVKFYGLNDYATFFHAERASLISVGFVDGEQMINDVLQLHNVLLFLENGVIPRDIPDDRRAAIRAQVPTLKRVVAHFFDAITEQNISDLVTDVDFQYHNDLLDLLIRHKVTDRCAGALVLPILQRNHVPLWEMLANRAFVRAYDADLRAQIISEPENAVFVLRKHLEKLDGKPVHLPDSLTTTDAANLVSQYIESDDANPNYLQLIAESKPSAAAGVTNKTRLEAKRANEAWMKRHFDENPNSGFRTGVQVSTSTQDEPVVATMNEGIAEYTYSASWLTENLDYATILNNFIHVFEFVNPHMQLSLPSFAADLSVMERIIGVSGRQHYKTGIAFQHKDTASLLQLLMYEQILASEDIDLEAVVAWFFDEFLAEEFGAKNFRFQPSSETATYLERCRHLFPEMDSVIKQYKLYVENGELDTDLLTMSSESVRFNDIPSLEPQKYVYSTDDQTILGIMFLLFSDQSPLHYISEDLQADTIVELIRAHELGRSDFHDYQQANLDFLISARILREADGKLTVVSVAQLNVLLALSQFEAASYLHFSENARQSIDEMIGNGWLRSSATLLSVAEAQYFNYVLNDSEFSNGPALRNNYTHGSQADAGNSELHRRTYITVMKLLIALVIKMNDDLNLHQQEHRRRTDQA